MKEKLVDKILGDKKTDYALNKIANNDWDDPEELVRQIADRLDVDLNTDPVNHIHELEDSPGKCFVWDVDMTEAQIIKFTQNFKSEFVKKYNRPTEALHFVRNDINSIKELSPGEVRERVEPWLNNKESGKE